MPTKAAKAHKLPFERMPAADICEFKPGATPEFREDVEAYFSCFVKPIKADKGDAIRCFCCGEDLTGMFAAILGKGGFTWGLAHGEGFCRCCKWPARAHHSAKSRDGGELFTLRNFILQYHPDEVVERKTAVAS